MCLSALTSVLSRSGTCGFFSSIGQSMLASGESASYLVTIRLGCGPVVGSCLSTESCTFVCSVTADRYAANTFNSSVVTVGRFSSHAFLLGSSWPLEPSACKSNLTCLRLPSPHRSEKPCISIPLIQAILIRSVTRNRLHTYPPTQF